MTATQAITRAYMQNGPDWITALYDLDTSCSPACSVFGPYAYFAEQYDSLAAISSIGRSNYHAMLLTLRKRYAGRHAVRHQLHAVEVRGHGVAGRARQRVRQLLERRQLGLPDQLVRSRAQLRHVRLRRAPSDQHQRPGGAAVRSGQALGRQRQQLRQRPDRRLVGGRPDAADERLPVQRRQLPLLLGDQLEPHRQRRCSWIRAGCRRPRRR